MKYIVIIFFSIILTAGTSFCQRQLTKEEILATWNSFQKQINKDSVFRLDIHKQTRTTLENLLKSGVDTILVYSESYSGYVVRNDSCTTLYPVNSYLFWRQHGKDFVVKVDGKCEGKQSLTNGKVIGFVLTNWSKINGEFFMGVTYSVVADGDRFGVSTSTLDHELKYEILLQMGGKVKYLRCTEHDLEDTKSMFYDYNYRLISYTLLAMIKEQTKNY